MTEKIDLDNLVVDKIIDITGNVDGIKFRWSAEIEIPDEENPNDLIRPFRLPAHIESGWQLCKFE